MTRTAPVPPLRFGDGAVHVRTENGSTYVALVEPLAPYAARTVDRLRHWAATAPQRTFVAKRDAGGQWRHLTYAQALDGARALGQALLARGLSPTRPLLILSGNDIEHALLALACQYVGVPYAPVSPAYSLVSQDFATLRHVVQVLRPGLVFAADGMAFAGALDAVRSAGGAVECVTGAPCAGATPFAQLAATIPTGAVDAAMRATGPDTIAKFLFTSGSTGQPKAVINTQRMLCANMQMLLQCWPFLADAPPVLVDWLPWHHTFGGNKSFNLVLFNGGTLYIDDGKPTPQLFGTTLANLRALAPTLYFNVPRGWEELAAALDADPALRASFYARLQLQFYAGAALSAPVWERLQANALAARGAPLPLITGLGMTETAPCALLAARADAGAGELGTPCPGLQIKLAPCGGKLELRYRGPNVTPGYWGAPQASAALFDEEGYLRSGDAVRWRDPAQPQLGLVFDGRVAEDFKLDSGTWVSVGALRARAVHAGAPYLQDVVVTGHDRADIGLLLIPNLPLCRQLAGLPAPAAAHEVCAAPAVRAFFQLLLARLHADGSGSASRVARALLLAAPPSIDRGEVTDKGSINQRAMLATRAALVDALYAGTDPAQLLAPTGAGPELPYNRPIEGDGRAGCN